MRALLMVSSSSLVYGPASDEESDEADGLTTGVHSYCDERYTAQCCAGAGAARRRQDGCHSGRQSGNPSNGGCRDE